MSQDEFTKLFTYMEKHLTAIHEEVEGLRKEVRQVYDVVDTVLKNQETEQQERQVVIRQVDRHEGWIHQLAEKAHEKLRYES